MKDINKKLKDIIDKEYLKKTYLDKDLFKKYSKKMLYDDILKDDEKELILDLKTIKYVSNIQNEFNKIGIINYISGGFALYLYLDEYIKKNIERNIIKVNDIDIVLFYKDNDISITSNIGIINNIKNIINICIQNIKKKIIKLYSTIIYNNDEEIDEIIKIILKDKYELFISKQSKIILTNEIINKNNKNIENIENKKNHKLFFIKKINDNYIKLVIKIVKRIRPNNFYSYNDLKIYYIKNNKKYNIFMPIEFLISRRCTLLNEIGKNIYIMNNILQIYNEKIILYNMMYLQYNYYIKNVDTLKRINEKKNERDDKRLHYFLEYFCKINKCIKNKKEMYEKLKDEVKLFNKPYCDLNNLDVINNLLINNK